MSDVIHLLPDNVANQIAAGEVIQRPASVLKELVENSIDAGATSVKVIVKDAGRTLLQVIDNGKGMSETDARLCFERHATSKITSADDLFALHTMGFRGEALPSISSVSQLELRTKRKEDEVGTCVEINGGKLESQSAVATPDGTSIAVKNLFFNVPARRKFLKSNTTEFSHIEKEFFRIVLVNPQTDFELYHNDKLVYQLRKGSLKERIVGVYGKSENSQLLVVEVNTEMVKIGGYIGKPETAKKQNEKQYFFVNGRYMKHPYFHKAIMLAFERLVPQGTSPDYFIYFEVNPSSIDVNIHPTKTEIKFENEQPIWAVLLAGVKESLGKFNVVPSLDFEHGEDLYSDNSFFSSSARGDFSPLTAKTDPTYNPFNIGSGTSSGTSFPSSSNYQKEKVPNLKDWGRLYEDFESDRMGGGLQTPSNWNMPAELLSAEEEQSSIFSDVEEVKSVCFQFKNKYIFTVTKSGLVCIDQHRAHTRVLYERFKKNLQTRKAVSQQLMFPLMLEVVESEAILLEEMAEDFRSLGFEMSNLGKGTISVNGIPSDCKESDVENYLRELFSSLKEGAFRNEDRTDRLALRLAEHASIRAGQHLSEEEMTTLISQLFSLPNPDGLVDNRKILTIFGLDEIEKRLK
jgi:DNA mismatch repair protein MutL